MIATIVKSGLVRWPAAIVLLFLVGCDLPERPPLPTTGRRRLDLNDLQAVRRAAGLPTEKVAQPERPVAPEFGRDVYSIETSAVTPGGASVVGRRETRVEGAGRLDDTQWLIDGGGDLRADRRDEAAVFAAEDQPRQSVASEHLWVRRGRAQIYTSLEVRERILPDGRVDGLAVRQRFGPIVRSLIGQVVQRDGGDRQMRVATGFSVVPNRGWGKQTFDLSPVQSGMLATPAAVSRLARLHLAGGDEVGGDNGGGDNGGGDKAGGDKAGGDKGGDATEADPVDQADRPNQADRPPKSLIVRTLGLSDRPGQILNPAADVRLTLAGSAMVAGGATSSAGPRLLTEIAAVRLPPKGDAGSAVQQEVYWVGDDGRIERKLRGDALLEHRIDRRSTTPITLPPRPRGGAAVSVGGKSFDPASAGTVAMRIAGAVETIDAAPGQAFRRSGNLVELVIDRRGRFNDSFTTWRRESNSADTAATRLVNYNQAEMRRLARASSRVSGGPAAVLDASNLTQAERVDSRIAADMLSVTSSLLADDIDDFVLPADRIISRGRGGSVSRSIVLMTLLRGRGVACTMAMGIAADGAITDGNRWMHFDCWVLARLDGQWHALVPRPRTAAGSGGIDPPPAGQPLALADRVVLATCQPTAEGIEAAMSQTLATMAGTAVEVAGSR